MKVLKKGSIGPDVTTLQKALGIAIDGKFGPTTDQAVRVFQLRFGLDVDGVVGPATWAALLKSAAPVVTPTAMTFDAGGWLQGVVRHVPINPGRVGKPIVPRGMVVHTTDTLGGMAAILKSWTETSLGGYGAHYLLGRRAATDADRTATYPSGGLVQMVPITRNGNHVGGRNSRYGRVMTPAELHPNSVYVGIELENGGRLVSLNGHFVHQDSGVVVPPDDVDIDERGKPWHKITAYQFETLAKVLDAHQAHMTYLPKGSFLNPNGTYLGNGVVWGAMPGTRFVGHVTLDPIQKTDPGPIMMKWLRDRYGNL